MTLVLRDSIDAPLIPTDTPVVAGYGDGRYIWSPNWRDGSNWFDLFPNSVKLVIVVFAPDAGDILDIETGDATPADAPGWCQRFNRPGRRAPTLYCNRGTWPLVIDALHQAGIDPAGPGVDWWISTLDGSQTVTVPPGGKEPVLIQYTDTGAYDESVILDPSWVGLEEDMTPDEHNQLDGLWKGWFAHDALIRQILANQGVEQPEVDKILAGVQTPPTVDVNALAAALIPHLPSGVDPQAVAKAVALELGKALDAAP